VQGVIRVRPNAKNPRDLDIEIDYSFNGKHTQARRLQQFRLR
jgi:protein arginine N-methyltransferase 1